MRLVVLGIGRLRQHLDQRSRGLCGLRGVEEASRDVGDFLLHGGGHTFGDMVAWFLANRVIRPTYAGARADASTRFPASLAGLLRLAG